MSLQGGSSCQCGARGQPDRFWVLPEFPTPDKHIFWGMHFFVRTWQLRKDFFFKLRFVCGCNPRRTCLGHFFAQGRVVRGWQPRTNIFLNFVQIVQPFKIGLSTSMSLWIIFDNLGPFFSIQFDNIGYAHILSNFMVTFIN